MCGLVNAKMNTEEMIEELTQVCIEMRSHLEKCVEQKDKEALVINHIKQFENVGAKVHDFQKGKVYLNNDLKQISSLGFFFLSAIMYVQFF